MTNCQIQAPADEREFSGDIHVFLGSSGLITMSEAL
jgi:hypothetical protein